jgi:ABC-type branched-subunit amino acid transport system ATPase component
VFAGITGAGGVVVVLLGQFDKIDQYQNLIAGFGVLIIAIRHPDGVMPEMVGGLRRLSSLLARTKRPPASAEPKGVPVELSPPESAPVRWAPSSADVSRSPGPPLLATVDLSVRYGSVIALDGVSIEVPAAHVVGLIGPNGAGKSTFVDAVTGFTPSVGAVTFAGHRVDEVKAHQRARMGLRRTFQSIELFEDLTVGENLSLGPRRPVEGAQQALEFRPQDVVEILGLGDVMARMPGELSNGERKLVGVARALIGHPRFLLLDEPAAGLDSRESELFGDRLLQISRAGVAVLLIDHDLDLIMNVSDHVYVLDRGRLIANGPPTSVREDKSVRTAYLGDVPAEDHVLSELANGGVR